MSVFWFPKDLTVVQTLLACTDKTPRSHVIFTTHNFQNCFVQRLCILNIFLERCFVSWTVVMLLNYSLICWTHCISIPHSLISFCHECNMALPWLRSTLFWDPMFIKTSSFVFFLCSFLCKLSPYLVNTLHINFVLTGQKIYFIHSSNAFTKLMHK